MANYYFLAPSLPPLNLGEKPDITFEELINRLEINLTKEDWEKTLVLRRMIDLYNIRAILLEEPIDSRGILSEKELDEALLVKSSLPDYVYDFLDQFESNTDRVRNFSGLLTKYFAEEIPHQTGFLQTFLMFERDVRLVLLGIRAKQLGRDAAQELQFEDFSDPIVAQILAQKDAAQYEPPADYADLKEVLASAGSDPWMRYKVFAQWKFNKLIELVDEPLFSIDWILSYMIRLMIAEDWYALDREKGKTILDTFTSE